MCGIFSKEVLSKHAILLFKLDGRENGMVICDLAVVGYAGNVRRNRNAGEKRKLAADDGNDLTGGVLHIVRDKLAVCARIGQELLFVECLYEIERLLGSEAVVAVRLALQGGQDVYKRQPSLYLPRFVTKASKSPSNTGIGLSLIHI